MASRSRRAGHARAECAPRCRPRRRRTATAAPTTTCRCARGRSRSPAVPAGRARPRPRLRRHPRDGCRRCGRPPESGRRGRRPRADVAEQGRGRKGHHPCLAPCGTAGRPEHRIARDNLTEVHGPVAQLVARLVRIEEVRGSNPLRSTEETPRSRGGFRVWGADVTPLSLSLRRRSRGRGGPFAGSCPRRTSGSRR